MSAAVEARNNVASTNAQVRAMGDQWQIEAKEQNKANFQTAVSQISSIAEGIVEDNVNANTNAYQTALNEKIMDGSFEYKNMNPEEGLCETWNDYWNNYTSFTEQWLEGEDADGKSNLTGGLLSKAATKTAINNYLNNSQTDIANSRKTQLWEQKVATQTGIRNTLLSEPYNEESYTRNMSTLIADSKFSDIDVTQLSDLSKVTAYGLNELYSEYISEKQRYEESGGQEANNYYEAALNLQLGMRAYTGNWGEQTFKNYMAGEEKQEKTLLYNLLNSVNSYSDSLHADLVEAWSSSAGDSTALEDFISKHTIDPFIAGQNKEPIRPDGLTDEELETANTFLKSSLTEEWYSLSTTSATLYEDLYTDMSTTNDVIFASMDDVLTFKKSSDKYNSLDDNYVVSQLKQDNSFMVRMANNATTKSIGEAIEVLGNAQTILPTLEGDKKTEYETKMHSAFLTLYNNGYWSYVSDYFEFGDNWLSIDDDGNWKNDKTAAIFEYQAKKKEEGIDMDFATAAIKSNFFDSISSGSSAGSSSATITGSFTDAFTYDTGRYMENNWEDFFDVAYNADSILLREYSQEEIDEKFSSEDEKIKEAARLKGMNLNSEQGLNALTTAYKTAKSYLSVGGSVVDDESALRDIFYYQTVYNNPNSTDKEKNTAGSNAIAIQKSVYLAMFPEQIGWGYMFYQSMIGDSSYNKDALSYAYANSVVSDFQAVKKTGSREKLMNLLDYYGITAKAEADPNSDYAKAISAVMDARDWKSVVDDNFIALVVDVAPDSMLNFYSVFADGVDISQTDYISGSGTVGSLEDQIKANTSSTYTAAKSAYLRNCYITKDDAVYGKDYNGVSVEGTDIVGTGGTGSEAFRTYAGLKAMATREVDILDIEAQAKGYLTADALKKLKESDSLNLALWSINYDGFNNKTLQDLIARKYDNTIFGKAQKDSSYTDLMSFLTTKTSLVEDCNEARERLANNEPSSQVISDFEDKLYGYCDDYITYSNEATIATIERQRNSDADSTYSFVGFMTTYPDETDLEEREKNAYDNLDSSRKESSKLESTYFAGDLTTRGHMSNIFSPEGTNTTSESQAENYNLAVNIQAGNVAKTDKNAVELLSWVMAYNEVAELPESSSITLTADDLTSDNIKNKTGILWDFMSKNLTPTQQYEVERLKNSISYTVKVVAQFEEYGFDDTLSYYYSDDGNTFFISDKAKTITINQNGSISYQLPDSMGGITITDISLYSDDANRNSVLHEAFPTAKKNELTEGYLGTNPSVPDFAALDGVNSVNQYNEIKEFLDGENLTGEEIVLMAYPTELKFISDNEIVEQGVNVDLNKSVTYECYPMRMSSVKSLYDYYMDNDLTGKADELCSMLTEKQADYVRTTSQTGIEEKRIADEKAEEEKLKTFSGFLEEKSKTGSITLVDVDEFLRNADNMDTAVKEIKEYQKSVPADSAFASSDIDALASYSSWAKDNPKPSDDDILSLINGSAYTESAILWVNQYVNDGVIKPKGKKWYETPTEYVERISANVAKEKVEYDEAFNGVIAEYSDGITTDQIDDILEQHEDEIDVYAAEMKKAIASGDITYLKGKRHYDNIDSYIDNKVKNIKKKMKMYGQEYQVDYKRLFGGSAEPQKDVTR